MHRSMHNHVLHSLWLRADAAPVTMVSFFTQYCVWASCKGRGHRVRPHNFRHMLLPADAVRACTTPYTTKRISVVLVHKRLHRPYAKSCIPDHATKVSLNIPYWQDISTSIIIIWAGADDRVLQLSTRCNCVLINAISAFNGSIK